MISGVVNWHIGRCGSSVLGALLAQHSQIDYANEIYSRYMPRRRGFEVVPAMDRVLDESRANIFKNWHLIEVKHLADQNLGLYPDCDLGDWLDLMLSRGYRHHIVMCRRNGLRRIVSHLRAARTGQYVVSASISPQPPMAVHIDINSIQHGFASRPLLSWLDLYEQSHERLLRRLECYSNELEFIEIVYEKHVQQNPIDAYGMVCDLLGLELEHVTIQHQRINPGSMSTLISNFDQVKSCLLPTRFAWMLDE